MDELKRLIELQCDPFSVYSTASRLTLVNEISRKSEPRDGNLPGSNYKVGIVSCDSELTLRVS